MKKKSFYISIFSLVILDQIIKIIIKELYFTNTHELMHNIFYFKPYINTDYSWINSLFNLNISLFIHLSFVTITGIIMFFSYDYIKYHNYNSKIIRILFVFWFSGVICSFVDKVFWGGSLDYIYLKPLFIFDLKDCYIAIGEILSILLIIKHWNDLNDFKVTDLIKYSVERVKNIISSINI